MHLRVAWLALLSAVAANSFAQPLDPEIMKGLQWREIGPFRGGRSAAVSGVVGRPDEFYMGTSGGGLWKSTDAGQNWACVSDGFFKTASVGDIAVSTQNPDLVYVGMGENAIRGNVSHGDGVYKSADGGKTWTHMGLKPTQTIGRVRIHPKDDNQVWVAALGPVYGASEHRGIYKTNDGGKTWSKQLFVNDRSGFIDLAMNPSNPDHLIAASWEAWRTPYSLNSGGPGSKIFETKDGGKNWNDISSRPGLPAGPLGRIGISFSGADPNRIYMMVEAKVGGLYRSDDGGSTFTLINGDSEIQQRPWYYNRVYADPKNKDAVWVCNVALHRSTDGGATFRGMNARHSDNHDFWIDPNDPNRLICANDGGATVSVDGGRTWTDQDYATAQFYHVSTDNNWPYRVLGAQQDNSTVRILSRGSSGRITRDDWESTAGGESGYVVAHPLDPDIVLGGNYSGTLGMINHRTGQRRSIDPWPENPIGGGIADVRHRMQWTFPIYFSPNDPNVLYTCSQHVMRSTDLGGSWQIISPDLTRNEKEKQQSSGGPITKDNTGVEVYATVFTLAESTKKKGLLWAGSDDGLVHVSGNGGRSWRNVTPKGAPTHGLCSMIEASPHDANKAILALDNHENYDHKPYIYITEDGGKTWENRVTGIDPEHYVRSVREDPVREGLLFAATEHGVYFSLNDGKQWHPLQLNLPNASVHDIVIKNSDLVAATHGRSFWILDDFSMLRSAPMGKVNEPTLFTPGTAYIEGGFGGGRRGGGGAPGGPGAGQPAAAASPTGQNFPYSGIIVNYYLPADAKEATLTLVDAAGETVASGMPMTRAGYHRSMLRPRYSGWTPVPGVLMWGAGPSSLKAPPGRYTVVLKVDGKEMKQPVDYTVRPLSPASEKDLQEQFTFSRKIARRVDDAHGLLRTIARARTALEAKGKPDAALLAKLADVENRIHQTNAKSGQDFLNYPIRVNNKLASLLGTVQSGDYAPTKQSYAVFEELDKQLKKLEEEVRTLTEPIFGK